MTEAKKHHYVPKFYLRNFSKNGKQVNLYNFSNDFFKTDAPIKGQCYLWKLHDFQPGLEQDLGTMENAAHQAIKTVLLEGKLPALESQKYLDLLIFFVFQKLRTERSIHGADVTKDFYVEQINSGKGPEPGSLLEKLTKDETASLQIIFNIIPRIAWYAADLHMQLLINDTSEDFITCDDPVAFHNMYCEGITISGVNGWDSAGLQVFLPLSPKILLMMYDNDVYRVDGNPRLPFVTSIKDVRDVRCLNTFQALNAHENVYFHGELTQELENFCRQKRKKRIQGRTTLVVTKPVTKANGTSSQLIHNFEPLLPIRLAPHFMKVRQSAQSVPLKKRATMFRHALPGDVHPNIRKFVQYEADQIRHR